MSTDRSRHSFSAAFAFKQKGHTDLLKTTTGCSLTSLRMHSAVRVWWQQRLHFGSSESSATVGQEHVDKTTRTKACAGGHRSELRLQSSGKLDESKPESLCKLLSSSVPTPGIA